jgi:hypothetical protein
VGADPFFVNSRDHIVGVHAAPAIYEQRETKPCSRSKAAPRRAGTGLCDCQRVAEGEPKRADRIRKCAPSKGKFTCQTAWAVTLPRPLTCQSVCLFKTVIKLFCRLSPQTEKEKVLICLVPIGRTLEHQTGMLTWGRTPNSAGLVFLYRVSGRGIGKMSEEIWLPIPGYEGLYEISNLGRLKSLARQVRRGNGYNTFPERIVKPSRNKGGYSQVHLSKDGKRITKDIHSLVLLAFEGPRPMGLQCRHFPDQNGANNYVINLSWDTREINEADKIINGTVVRGEKCHTAKLTEEQVQAIFHATGDTQEIAKRFGISRRHVNDIKSGKKWRHLNLAKTN